MTIPAPQRIVVTGGAGFIGCNLAQRLIQSGAQVQIVDNLSRRGTAQNIRWLRDQFGDTFEFVQSDIRDPQAVVEAIGNAQIVYHLASQTAVTTSVTDPRNDFEINALGTLNILEAARARSTPPIVVYASTNKVYGGMEHVRVDEGQQRYSYRDLPDGVDELQPLDFHSPYGCSKGAADQYVRDYARIYNVPTVVLRQSCIYGPRQLGVEDQGWVAWFLIALTTGQPIAIYGNGKQVRDLLYIDDLIDAYLAVVRHIDTTAGQIYNLGGGPRNAVSVWWELKPILENALDRSITDPPFLPWRPGDQPIFIANTSKAQHDFGWAPQVSAPDGIKRLAQWIRSHRDLFTRTQD